MRDRLVLLAVLGAALALAAALVFPRAPRPLPSDGAPPADLMMPARSGHAGAGGAAGSGDHPPSSMGDGTERANAADAANAAAHADSAAASPLPPYVHIDPASPTACGEGMVLVDGIYCPYVGHSCTAYSDEPGDVCQRFASEVLCEGRLLRRRFCIDVFEYPNLAGVVPVVMVDWNDARRACAVEGKRLCSSEEWEFACEGTQMWPYPYGIDRDAEACNIDRPVTMPIFEAFGDPWKISEEVERLDRRAPSGAFARCVSPFGARDMTGNVDEWVDNKDGKLDETHFRSTLKGGYWGPIRARCRPITSTHNEWFNFYQVGFRCCRDASSGEKAILAAPSGATIPRKQRMELPTAGAPP
jgi:formylglycine-generating enzyme